MTSQPPPRPPGRRTPLHAGVIVIAVVLALLLVVPGVWARGQIYLVGLARVNDSNTDIYRSIG